MQLQRTISLSETDEQMCPLATENGDLPEDVISEPAGFEASTPIRTPSGITQVGALAAGDLVTTHTGRAVRIVSVNRRHLSAAELHNRPDDAPIRFDPAALPGMLDGITLLLSGDLPMTVPAMANGPDGSEGDAPQISQFPARAFCDGGLIRRVIPEEGVHYVKLCLEGTHQICAAGLWVEADACCQINRPATIPSQWHGRDTCEFRPIR